MSTSTVTGEPVALSPERATFLSNLGYAEQQLGETANAVITLNKAIAKDPKLGSAWINLGSVLVDGRFSGGWFCWGIWSLRATHCVGVSFHPRRLPLMRIRTAGS